MQHREFIEAATESYRRHVLRAADPLAYVRTAHGAPLGVDGLDAIRATPNSLFVACLVAAVAFHAKSGAPLSLKTWLATCDELLAASRGIPNRTWVLVTVAIAGIDALGGPPGVCSCAHAIFNDSLMLALSKNYRAARIWAYNEGASFEITSAQKDEIFRPDFGVISLGPPIVTTATEVPTTQFYNVSHELSHIALLGDTYLRSKGSKESTAATFLASEESLIGLDLLMMYELNAHGVHFHAADSFRGIEPGMQETVPVSVATLAAADSKLILRRQRELKAHAARESGWADPLSRWLVQRCRSPMNLDQWVPRAARQKHIDGAAALADRVCDPLFAHLVAFIPEDAVQRSNEQSAMQGDWGHGDSIFGIDIPEVCPRRRDAERLRWDLRRRLVQLVEALVHANRFSPAVAAARLAEVRKVLIQFGPLAARGELAPTEQAPLCEAIRQVGSRFGPLHDEP